MEEVLNLNSFTQDVANVLMYGVNMMWTFLANPYSDRATIISVLNMFQLLHKN